MVATDLGFHALVFDEDDVGRLLRAAVEREGGQGAFAKHHGVDRAYLNMILNGRRPVSDSIARGYRSSQGLYRRKVGRGLGGNERAPSRHEERALTADRPAQTLQCCIISAN